MGQNSNSTSTNSLMHYLLSFIGFIDHKNIKSQSAPASQDIKDNQTATKEENGISNRPIAQLTSKSSKPSEKSVLWFVDNDTKKSHKVISNKSGPRIE